jgi:hypothetical protein
MAADKETLHQESTFGSSSPAEREPRPGARPISPRGLLGLTLGAGLVAGLVSFVEGELGVGAFEPRRVLVQVEGRMERLPTRATVEEAATKNAELAFGVKGSILGLYFGLAGGLGRRSAVAAGLSGLFGMAAGAAVGIAVPAVVLPGFFWAFNEFDVDELVPGLVMHAVIWGSLGAIAGLAFGMGLGRHRLRALVGGVVGGIVGATVYQLLGSLVFPLEETEQPLSKTWWTRAQARLIAGLAMGVAVGWSSILAERTRCGE